MSGLLPTAAASSSKQPSFVISRPSSPFVLHRSASDAYDAESQSSDELPSPRSANRQTFAPPNQYRHQQQQQHPHTHPPYAHSSTTNPDITSVHHTPSHSRAPSPTPYSAYYSDDDLPHNPLLNRALRPPPKPRWITPDGTQHKRSRSRVGGWRRVVSFVVYSPFFPSQPSTILLTVTIILSICLSITLFLMYLLNPDKAPLPWRSYCALTPPFPVDQLSKYPPVGVFIGVMSTASAVERRMLIRSTWASHARSRGLDGSTDRTVVRFILGIPQSDWTRRLQLEAESYKDIVILPVSENMNNGKTHAYIDWAHHNALVPPPSISYGNASHQNPVNLLSPYQDSSSSPPSSSPFFPSSVDISKERHRLFPSFSANHHGLPHGLAPHDPHHLHLTNDTSLSDWVRPQFVIKADDDAFVMLSELEARLRLEWYSALEDAVRATTMSMAHDAMTDWPGMIGTRTAPPGSGPTISPVRMPQGSTSHVVKRAPSTATITQFWHPAGAIDDDGVKSIDPMVYWGYLVKARFMAGELYALSSSLVEYIATTPSVRASVRGKEDKVTARWIRQHPHANEVRWRSERCWIYDHPRAGTVYSHGFLFPSEVEKVRTEVSHDLTPAGLHLLPEAAGSKSNAPASGAADPSLTHSTVSRFGTHYRPPASNLTTEQEVEALVEGSALSRLRDETVDGAHGEATPREVESAWRRRESRWMRTVGAMNLNGDQATGAVGGTVVVHFIKRNEWFLETAIAFLEDEPDPPPLEDGHPWQDDGQPSSGSGQPGAGGVGGGGNRVETDLSNKTPFDSSHIEDPDLPPSNPSSSSSSGWRIETDLSHKKPLLWDLDPVEDPETADAPSDQPPTADEHPPEDSPPLEGNDKEDGEHGQNVPADDVDDKAPASEPHKDEDPVVVEDVSPPVNDAASSPPPPIDPNTPESSESEAVPEKPSPIHHTSDTDSTDPPNDDSPVDPSNVSSEPSTGSHPSSDEQS